MYAIIATGGKQYKVEEGDVIKVEKLGVDAGETVTFDQVLAVNNGELQIGCPTVAGATVTATVEKEGKGKKVIVYSIRERLAITRRTAIDSSIRRLRLTRSTHNHDHSHSVSRFR